MGPGIITGAADNDPAGVVTYTRVGATTGFSLLWLMLLSTPMLFFVEEMSSRLGIVAKRGLARVVRKHYGLSVGLFVVTVFAISNTVTIAAEIAGMAAAAMLLTGVSWLWFVPPITGFVAYLLLARSYQQVNRFLLVLTPIFFLYILTAFVIRPNWAEVLFYTLIPHLELSFNYLIAALGLLGATLTPYILFWQVTELVELHRSVKDLQDEALDVAAGMAYANLVFYFIIVSSVATLYGRGVAVETVADAAGALRPIVGGFAFILLSIGILASGIMCLPILAASTAYAIADLAGWPKGLDKGIHEAPDFYLALLLSLVVGVIIAVIGLPPAALMFWSQVLNGVLLPVLLVFLLRLTNDPRVMRRHTNGLLSNLFGGLTIAIAAGLPLLALINVIADSIGYHRGPPGS